MTGRTDTDKEDLSTLCQFEGRLWKHQYIVKARKAVDQSNAYRFFWFFFYKVDVVDLGGVFYNMSSLSAKIFEWLQGIHP